MRLSAMWCAVLSWTQRGVRIRRAAARVREPDNPTTIEVGGRRQRAIDVGSAAKLMQDGRLVVSAPFAQDPILVVVAHKGVFAVTNVCPHAGRVLSDALVFGGYIECPGHGRRFNLASGRAIGERLPVPRLRTWAVSLENGRVWIWQLGDTCA